MCSPTISKSCDGQGGSSFQTHDFKKLLTVGYEVESQVQANQMYREQEVDGPFEMKFESYPMHAYVRMTGKHGKYQQMVENGDSTEEVALRRSRRQKILKIQGWWIGKRLPISQFRIVVLWKKLYLVSNMMNLLHIVCSIFFQSCLEEIKKKLFMKGSFLLKRTTHGIWWICHLNEKGLDAADY